MIECPLCGGTLKRTKISMSFLDNKVKVNNIKADVCVVCGEQYLSSNEVKRVKREVLKK